MDYFMPSINSSWQVSPLSGMGIPNKEKISPEAAAAQFTSVFLQNMLKKIFKNESKNNFFGENNAGFDYSDMFIDQMLNELAENDAFGLNKIVESSINKRDIF